MKLRSPGFEARTYKLLNAELSGSAALKKEFKIHSRRRTGELGMPMWFFKGLIGFALLSVIQELPDPNIGFAFAALWAMGISFSMAIKWVEVSFAEPDISVLKLLPVTDRKIFQHQNRKFFAGPSGARGALESMVVIYAVLWGAGKTGPHWLWFVVAALLQTGLVAALGFVIARFAYRLPHIIFAFGFRAAALSILYLQTAASLIVPAADALPPGWINSAILQPSSTNATYLLPVVLVGLFYLAHRAWVWFRDNYSLADFSSAFEWQNAPEQDVDPIGVTQAADEISSREFLSRPSWTNKGFFERLANKFLSANERKTAEFLMLDHPVWTPGLKRTLYYWTGCLAGIQLLGNYSEVIILFTILILLSSCSLLGKNDWPALANHGVIRTPYYAFYPVDFASMARVIIKVNILRMIIVAPLLVMFGGVIAISLNSSFKFGMLIGIKYVVVFLTLLPLLALSPFAGSNNDSARFAWARFAAFVFGMLALVVASGFALLSKSPVYAISGLGVNFAVAAGLHVLYRRAYNACKYDLQARAEASQAP